MADHDRRLADRVQLAPPARPATRAAAVVGVGQVRVVHGGVAGCAAGPPARSANAQGRSPDSRAGSGNEGAPCRPLPYPNVVHSLDVSALRCPMTWVRTKLELDRLQSGETLEVTLPPGEALENVPRSAREAGHDRGACTATTDQDRARMSERELAARAFCASSRLPPRAARDCRTSRGRPSRRPRRCSTTARSSATARQLLLPEWTRDGADRAARRERAGDRRGRARLAGRAVPRRGRRRAARASSTTTTSRSPTCTASRCTSRPTWACRRPSRPRPKLRFLNPDIVVETYQVRVDEDNVARAGRGPGPRDRLQRLASPPATRSTRPAATAGVDLVEGGAVGWSGPRDDDPARAAPPATAARSRRRRSDAPTCAEAGMLGPAAGVIGSLQALEALKFLTGAQPPLRRRVPQRRPRDAGDHCACT